ncbi:hypothetical protein [Asanoa siamensis]|uniref:Uncharacterized protein n=1 Tax=Asanoa siamensis TaxID=926357 RepID=A0ABQ4CMJ0_9ACTN|nr:hypothetical protein [Asanoa siamensis]GIF72511.1 hypothetical protein Asi02nite_20290 [Asanoa siamensis]
MRDALAGLSDEQLPELAVRWAAIEEFGGFVPADVLVGTMGELAGLARRARAAGEHLYCWICL